jgi:hypothetical protein
MIPEHPGCISPRHKVIMALSVIPYVLIAILIIAL